MINAAAGKSLISYGQPRSGGPSWNRTGLTGFPGGRDPRAHRNQASECNREKKRCTTVVRNNVGRDTGTDAERRIPIGLEQKILARNNDKGTHRKRQIEM